MTDREIVIYGLEHCTGPYTCSGCRYYNPNNTRCQKYLMHDALELLREDRPQKPIEKHYEITVNHVWGDEVEVISEFYCPHCMAIIAKGNSEHYPRCMWCGREVKWNG